MYFRWRHIAIKAIYTAGSISGLYLFGAVIVFDYSSNACKFDEEYRDGHQVVLGPLPRWPLASPHYDGGFDGKEWPFRVYPLVCSAWRHSKGYATPSEWRSSPYHDRPFDRSVWISAAVDTKADNPRGKMAQDVVDLLLKKGMSSDEVIRLLGKPSREIGRKDVFRFTNQRRSYKLYLYFLGKWGEFHTEDNYLYVSFDRSGQMNECGVFE
jgi:hypothetical protein